MEDDLKIESLHRFRRGPPMVRCRRSALTATAVGSCLLVYPGLSASTRYRPSGSWLKLNAPLLVGPGGPCREPHLLVVDSRQGHGGVSHEFRVRSDDVPGDAACVGIGRGLHLRLRVMTEKSAATIPSVGASIAHCNRVKGSDPFTLGVRPHR